MATTPTTITSLLTQQDNLLLQIATVDAELATVQHAIKEFQLESNALEQERKRIAYSLRELDKALIQAICPTDEAFRRFRNSVLGFAQSSSEG